MKTNVKAWLYITVKRKEESVKELENKDISTKCVCTKCCVSKHNMSDQITLK